MTSYENACDVMQVHRNCYVHDKEYRTYKTNKCILTDVGDDAKNVYETSLTLQLQRTAFSRSKCVSNDVGLRRGVIAGVSRDFRSRLKTGNCIDDDDDDDGSAVCSRPRRPEFVPKIDLSWTSNDEEERHESALCHATPGNCADHVTKDAGRRRRRARTTVGCRCRRGRRHLAAKYGTKRHRTALPLAPRRTPPPEIVRRLDTPETESEDDEPETECGGGNARVCRSEIASCGSRDVTHDESLGVGSDGGTTQHYTAGSVPAEVHVTGGVRTRQTGSSSRHVDAVGFFDDLFGDTSPSSSAASKIVLFDGGDEVGVERKSERESSASLAERLLCALDCCHCCRLTMTFYRLMPRH